MTKLFKLTIEIPVVVLADDVTHVRGIAADEFREIASEAVADGVRYADVQQIQHVGQLPAGWDAQCFPYGGPRDTDDDRIAGILKQASE